MSLFQRMLAHNRRQPGSGGAAQSTRPSLRIIVVLMLGPLLLAFLRGYPQFDLTYHSGAGHFWIVTAAAAIAVALVLLMLRAGVVRRDGRVLLIGGAYLALSGIFLVHAISTPGVLFANTGLVTAWSTPIALLAAAIILSLSTIERFALQSWLVRRWRFWLGGEIMLLLLYGIVMLFWLPIAVQPTARVQVQHVDADHAVALAQAADTLPAMV